MFDIIIIGAGPSGATLARLLAVEKKVLLPLKNKHFSLAKVIGILLKSLFK